MLNYLRLCKKNVSFLYRFYFNFTPHEIILSFRKSLQNGLYIDNKNNHFDLLVQNPKPYFKVAYTRLSLFRIGPFSVLFVLHYLFYSILEDEGFLLIVYTFK